MEGLTYDAFALICDALLPAWEEPLVMDVLFPHFYALYHTSTQLRTWICKYVGAYVRLQRVIPLLLGVPCTPLRTLDWGAFERRRNDAVVVRVVMLAYCRHRTLMRFINDRGPRPVDASGKTVMQPILAALALEDKMEKIYQEGMK